MVSVALPSRNRRVPCPRATRDLPPANHDRRHVLLAPPNPSAAARRHRLGASRPRRPPRRDTVLSRLGQSRGRLHLPRSRNQRRHVQARDGAQGDRPHPPFRPHRARGIGRGNGPRRPPPRQGPRRPGQAASTPPRRSPPRSMTTRRDWPGPVAGIPPLPSRHRHRPRHRRPRLRRSPPGSARPSTHTSPPWRKGVSIDSTPPRQRNSVHPHTRMER